MVALRVRRDVGGAKSLLRVLVHLLVWVDVSISLPDTVS